MINRDDEKKKKKNKKNKKYSFNNMGLVDSE